MITCSFTNNRLFIKTENSLIYNLNLRPPITIIHDNSGTGKTMLVNLVNDIKKSSKYNSIELTDFKVETFSDDIDIVKFSAIRNSLIIIDRADMLLEDRQDVLNCILDNVGGNTYLIISRRAFNFGVSPNYYGSFKSNANIIEVKYDFSEKGWF